MLFVAFKNVCYGNRYPEFHTISYSKTIFPSTEKLYILIFKFCSRMAAFLSKKCNKRRGRGRGRPDFMPKMSPAAKCQPNSAFSTHGWRQRHILERALWILTLQGTRYFLLSRSQAGSGRTVKQEQEEISRKLVQTFSGCSVLDWRGCEIFLAVSLWPPGLVYAT